MPDVVQHHRHMINGQQDAQSGPTAPIMPGQDVFGAIQEIVRILEADPKTDWSKVNLESLSQHLIDMNEVTLQAEATAKPIDGGLAIAVTGEGRTLAAIQRMLPAHAREINGHNGWRAKTETLPSGELLTVASSDPQEVQHISGLGLPAYSSAARTISHITWQWPRASLCTRIETHAPNERYSTHLAPTLAHERVNQRQLTEVLNGE